MSRQPIGWELVEDAIGEWLRDALPEATLHFVEAEDVGAWLPAPPAAQIECTNGPIAIGQPEIRKVPSTMVQRVTVTAAGPGVAGVDFRLGFDLTPTQIAVAVGPGVLPDAAAVLLLAKLVANLPAGVTAEADPEDPASVLVSGSGAQPLFSCAAVAGSLTSVATLRERFPELECAWSRLVWRVSFRSAATRGSDNGGGLMARAKAKRVRVLTSKLHAAGWTWRGELAALPSVPADRNESLAVLDFQVEGYATIAYNVPAARAIGCELTTT